MNEWIYYGTMNRNDDSTTENFIQVERHRKQSTETGHRQDYGKRWVDRSQPAADHDKIG